MSRGSRGGVVAWAVMAAAVLLLLAIPATALVVDARGGAAGRGVPLATGGLSTIEGPVGAMALLARSLAWAVAVAAGAAIAGSFAARGLAFAWFGAARGRSIAPAVATVALGSLTLLPPSLLVYSLWSATGPGTALGEWTGLGEDAVRGRHLSLALGLLLWATPAATIVVAAWRAAHPDRGIELRRLDGVRGAAEVLARARHARPGAFLAMLAVGLGIFGETVGFDLAQVRTYGYELRALDALGAAPGELVRLAWPAAVVAVA